MTIDTLEYTKKLEAAGVDRKVAEAHAEALKAAVETSLVTKDYLDKRLLQHTIAVVAAFSAIAGLVQAVQLVKGPGIRGWESG